MKSNHTDPDYVPQGPIYGATHNILRTTPIQQLYQSSLQCQHFRRIQSIQRRSPSRNPSPNRRNHGSPRRPLSFPPPNPSLLRRPPPWPHSTPPLKSLEEKDRDIQIYDNLPDGVSYELMLKNSRFCLCPSGYEVASPRVVKAIYAECVPVLISDGYVPPFKHVLNWKAFSISLAVKDIPNIKKIPMGISQNQYLRLHRRVKQVQRHFVINGPPKRFDIFHMVIHSVWLWRLNVHIQD
ncbi:putative glycosyltransferase [Camellia lanceoleosa]|uniref:Glycosyltransferase n=1 Tax=Camellia lanceoleosa TaxID=1840588 RepID=A0ACC0H3I6_9ERIC|nr:putative glycosyltransferase [Camellia lanceoleosa]